MKIQDQNLDNCFFLLCVQADLPKTSLFFSAQIAVLSSFIQMFIVLGMYNFGCKWGCVYVLI